MTSIYLKRYIPDVESSFAIVAEPNRRAILSLLLASERSLDVLWYQPEDDQLGQQKGFWKLIEEGEQTRQR